jgi:hypothetical protein
MDRRENDFRQHQCARDEFTLAASLVKGSPREEEGAGGRFPPPGLTSPMLARPKRCSCGTDNALSTGNGCGEDAPLSEAPDIAG